MESYTTVSEAIEGLKARGFTTDFEFINGEFRGFRDGRTFEAGELTIVDHYRFEGISNPDDESIVFAIESNDGVRGVLVDAYGLYANPELAAFLKNVAIQRGI